MNSRSFFRFLAVSLFALTLSGGVMAKDKEGYPEIKLVKIQQFDPTLSDAKSIHDSLFVMETKLKDANKGLAKTLNLPETTSVDECLTELKKRANGKVRVAMKGRVPKLEPSDAIPSDVQAGIDAVNGMMDDLEAGLTQVEAMPPKVNELIGSAKSFPGQLNADLIKQNNLAPTELPKIAKTLGADVKAIEATPERIKGVTDQTMNLFSKVQSTFAN